MSFLATVRYSSSLKDNSLFAKAEAAADVCRAPGRWVASNLWNGGKVTVLSSGGSEGLQKAEYDKASLQGARKVVTVVVGLLLALPGHAVGAVFMGIAFASKEIRLKHKVAHKKLTDDELAELKRLIAERQKMARQGCEPISCILCSILCVLCCKSNGNK